MEHKTALSERTLIEPPKKAFSYDHLCAQPTTSEGQCSRPVLHTVHVPTLFDLHVGLHVVITSQMAHVRGPLHIVGEITQAKGTGKLKRLVLFTTPPQGVDQQLGSGSSMLQFVFGDALLVG